LCWASVLTQDVVAPLSGPISDKGRIRLTRIFVALQGLFLLGWGLWFPAPKSLWSYMVTTGAIYLSGASAIVVLGLYWRRASSAGAMAALLCGLTAVIPVVAQTFPDRVKELQGGAEPSSFFDSFLLFASDGSIVQVSAFALSWTAMIVFSVLFPDRPSQEESAS
ncbi:MAG: hypothetical protein AAF517_16660, partial [Planctomycetota bacterium]